MQGPSGGKNCTEKVHQCYKINHNPPKYELCERCEKDWLLLDKSPLCTT